MYLRSEEAAPCFLVELVVILLVELLVHSLEMDHLILSDEVDEPELEVYLQRECLDALYFYDFLNDEVEEESNVSLKEKVIVVLEHGLPSLLLVLVVAHYDVTLA